MEQGKQNMTNEMKMTCITDTVLLGWIESGAKEIRDMQEAIMRQNGEVERLRSLIEKLGDGIRAYRRGNNPNLQDYTVRCTHGVSYWEECAQCNIQQLVLGN